MSIILFLFILFTLVLVHEFGHFIVAKMTGMRVDEFGIGFPPKLFGMKRGETEYTFNLFPIGGFVKIFGEDGAPSHEVSEQTVAHADTRSFGSKSKWAQAAVLVAGVSMNILFAWFLFTIAFSTGVSTAVDEATAGPHASLIVTEVTPHSPASIGLLPVGAKLTAVSADGDTLTKLTPSSFSAFIGARGEKEVTVTYKRGNTELTTTLVPKVGAIPTDPQRAAIGIALTMVDTVVEPFPLALRDAFFHTGTSIRDVAFGLFGLIRDTVTFHADFSQVAGPIGIVGLVGDASAFGLSALFMFTAFISLNLAVINLLPFPALDGGRLLFVIIEAIKGSAINPRIAQTVNTIGFAFLIVLMVLVTWHDIVRIIS